MAADIPLDGDPVLPTDFGIAVIDDASVLSPAFNPDGRTRLVGVDGAGVQRRDTASGWDDTAFTG